LPTAGAAGFVAGVGFEEAPRSSRRVAQVEDKPMPLERRELYSSPNGDRWFLSRDPATGDVFIRHEANIPSGGRHTDIDIGDFLSGGRRNPEHQALLHLIGTLVGGIPQTARRADLAERRHSERHRGPDHRPGSSRQQ